MDEHLESIQVFKMQHWLYALLWFNAIVYAGLIVGLFFDITALGIMLGLYPIWILIYRFLIFKDDDSLSNLGYSMFVSLPFITLAPIYNISKRRDFNMHWKVYLQHAILRKKLYISSFGGLTSDREKNPDEYWMNGTVYRITANKTQHAVNLLKRF